MRSTETRALIPFEGVQSIDGHHLNRYLRYKGLVPERLLPPHIDLSLYTNVFNNLYANSQGAYVVPEEVRQKYFAEIDARGEPTHEVIRMIREQAISDINQQAPGERHVTVYQDEEDDIIKISPITFGKYTNVETDIIDIARQGNNPLFGIHTHPANIMFSPQDYLLRLFDSGSGEGLIKGQVILCPDIQILAISTEKTPHMEYDDAEELVKRWSDEFKKAPSGRAETLYDRQRKIQQLGEQVFLQNFRDSMSSIGDIEKRMNEGEFTEEVALEMAHNERKKHLDRLNEYLKKYRRVHSKTIRNLYDLTNRVSNEILIDFARLINVKLYVSTDRKNFRAFSA